MAVTTEYLSGGRIQGRSDDSVTVLDSVPQTSWKQLSKTTLSSAGDTIDSGTITAKDNLMILIHEIGSGSITGFLQFNSDTGSNYSERTSENGASGGTATSQTKIRVDRGNTGNFIICKIRNNASQEKLVISECVGLGAAGTGTATERWETVGKWANTSNQITSIQVQNASGGSFDTGSEMVVLGCDDDEADSGTNFWAELTNKELSSASATFNTDTFTAKKYLMVEIYGNQSSGNSDTAIRFNSDTGSNYCRRYSTNGGSDGTGTANDRLNNVMAAEGNRDPFHSNSFILNKSDQEKLIICHLIFAESGAGAGNAPSRRETVNKWVNTASQITSIQVLSSPSVAFDAGSFIRVWGSD